MERHERGIKLRRMAVAAIYFLIIICLLIFYLVLRQREQQHKGVKQDSALVEKNKNGLQYQANPGSNF